MATTSLNNSNGRPLNMQQKRSAQKSHKQRLISFMKSTKKRLVLSLLLLSALSLSGCTLNPTVQCEPIKMDKWITDKPAESLDLERKLIEALGK